MSVPNPPNKSLKSEIHYHISKKMAKRSRERSIDLKFVSPEERRERMAHSESANVLLRMDRRTRDYLYQQRRDKSVTFLETDTGWLPAAANGLFFQIWSILSGARTHAHIREWEWKRGKRKGKWIMNLRKDTFPRFFATFGKYMCSQAHLTLRTEIL